MTHPRELGLPRLWLPRRPPRLRRTPPRRLGWPAKPIARFQTTFLSTEERKRGVTAPFKHSLFHSWNFIYKITCFHAMPNTFSKAKFYVSIPINNSKKKSEKREMLASHLYHHLYCVYIYYYYWPYPIPVNSTYFREQINESTESDVSSLAPH